MLIIKFIERSADPVDDRPSVAEWRASPSDGATAGLLAEIAATGLAWAAAEDAMLQADRGASHAFAALPATRAFDAHRAALRKVRA